MLLKRESTQYFLSTQECKKRVTKLPTQHQTNRVTGPNLSPCSFPNNLESCYRNCRLTESPQPEEGTTAALTSFVGTGTGKSKTSLTCYDLSELTACACAAFSNFNFVTSSFSIAQRLHHDAVFVDMFLTWNALTYPFSRRRMFELEPIGQQSRCHRNSQTSAPASHRRQDCSPHS